jgi:general secretion pathway protein K
MTSAGGPLKTRASTGDERGIALIMVLWVLTVLMVIVLAFSYMGRTETQASLAFKQGVEKKFLAEAGIERGIMEIAYGKMNPNAQFLPEGGEAWKADGTPYTVKTDDGYYTVSIIDESGKININTLNDSSAIIMKNLLMNSGVQEPEADTIVDSILDWKDTDDLTRLHGAESDYYSSLPNPYKAKNGDFDTLEELLLVKGMTPEILYGADKKKGLIDLLTVNSKSVTINANAAPKEVLMAIPGITAEVAEAMVSSRGNPADAASTANLQGFLAAVKPPFNSLVTLGAAGGAFTIESSAYKGDSKGPYTVKATVVIEGNNKFKYMYYKSPAKNPAKDHAESNGGSDHT